MHQKKKRYTIIVCDLLGKEFFKEIWQANAGLTEYPIDLNKLRAGVYVLTVRSSTEERTIKITKE